MTPLEVAAREPWDAIVVGSGAGGAVAAWRLAVAGRKVLVLERGARVPRRPRVPDEIEACRRDLFVPAVAADPRVVARAGQPPERTHEGWTAVCVGGGTVHMSAMLYRMHDEDFASWPFPASRLRPYYDRVQAAIGLAGVDGEHPFEPAKDPYPHRPLAAHPAAEAVAAAARAAGLHPFTTPRGHLPVDDGERRACIRCGFCGSYACPTGAKASTTDTFLPAAEATGRCRVLERARVLAVEAPGGRAEAVAVEGDVRLRAPLIVLACSAVETARLLLVSRLGNAQVGRNLVFALESAGRAVFPLPSPLFPRDADRLPFLNLSLQDRYRDLGTLVFERPHPNPIQRALRLARGALGPPLVAALRRELLEEREVVWESFIAMAPRAGVRVELDADVRDAAGQPAARIVLDTRDDEQRRAAALGELARGVLARLKPARIDAEPPRMTAFLQAGTCRMGDDPLTSSVDPNGRLHGVAGVHVVDGAALPSMGAVPPTLTIMANAWRIADGLA